MVYTPTTHRTMEKQTQEGLGEGDLGRARKLGHVTEEAAAQAESRAFQRRKAVTLGTLGDSKQSPSMEGPILSVTPLWPVMLFFQIFHICASSSEDGSGCPGPSSPACCSLLASTHPGLFPSTDIRPSRDKNQAQSFSGVPLGQRGLQAHTGQ